MKRSLKIVLAVVVGLFGLFYYLNNHTVIPIVEVTCKTRPITIIQINEYAPITALWRGKSDGNIEVTLEDGFKMYLPDIRISGSGNQKVVRIMNEEKWQKYIVGARKLYFDGKAYQCVAS